MSTAKAGIKNKEDGHFTEVMLIRSYVDELKFKFKRRRCTT